MATWSLSMPCSYHASTSYQDHSSSVLRERWGSVNKVHRRLQPLFASFSSSSPYAPSSKPPAPYDAQRPPQLGFTVVEEFYDGINRRDLDSVRDLIAADCIFEDLVFPEPFIGREAILEFFSRFTGAVGLDLRFAIDDITRDDPSCVGVTWHLEWRGKPFPFSKGCSFYRLTTMADGKQQIIYGRDSVEPAIKPGDAALVAIRAVAALLERFPRLSDWF